MAVNFSQYMPPGIYSNPIDGPQLAINSTLPTAVALIGTAIGYRTFTESIQFDDTDAQNPETYTLQKKGIIESTIVVRNAITLNTYAGVSSQNTTNYTIEDVAGEDGLAHPGTKNAMYGIRRNPDTSTILPDATVEISYTYVDSDYFQAHTFYDYRDVVNYYGDPFIKNSFGKSVVNSELSLGAKFAFLNGAGQVTCIAVEPTGTDGTATSGDYATALDKLQGNPTVAVIVPCSSKLEHEKLASHVDSQSSNRFERRAIIGFDSTVTSSGRKDYANLIKVLPEGSDGGNPRVMMVSPSKFEYYVPEHDQLVELPGHYMAASLAGMTCAMSFAQPLTHKFPVGWRAIKPETSLGETNGRLLYDGEMTEETKNGLCVIEYDRRKSLRIRHGVSTKASDLLSREWSITGQQDALVYRLRDYLDDANLIGQPIYNYTLINVKASAEAALQSLVRDDLLVDYTGLSVRQLLTNPDVIEISFGWRPAFPLNYIVLTFAVSLSTGSLNVRAGTANQNNISSTTQTGIVAPMSSSFNDFGGSSNTLNAF